MSSGAVRFEKLSEWRLKMVAARSYAADSTFYANFIPH
jgi:hypothetical protein